MAQVLDAKLFSQHLNVREALATLASSVSGIKIHLKSIRKKKNEPSLVIILSLVKQCAALESAGKNHKSCQLLFCNGFRFLGCFESAI